MFISILYMFRQLCAKLVIYQKYTEMRGQQNIRICTSYLCLCWYTYQHFVCVCVVNFESVELFGILILANFGIMLLRRHFFKSYIYIYILAL
jgi:hypothetical protein